MNKNIFVILLSVVLLIPLISAIDYLPHKQSTTLAFSITSNNATSCVLTYIDSPLDLILINQTGQKTSQTFNFTVLADNFSNTGKYDLNIECFDGATYVTGSVGRVITPSGSSLDSSASLTLFGSLVVMIIVSLVFLFIALKSESIAVKTTFFSISGLGFLMVILFTVVTIQQVLFGFDSIISGIETFWFVAKMGVGIGIFAIFIIIGLILYKSWKIKRGFDD